MLYVDLPGARVPALGFGTWRLTGAACRDAVRSALSLGYRHLDTAAMYDNEDEVGMALDESTVPRADVFLTTKVWTENLRASDLVRSAEGSLRKLRTDYVDLLLVHWPNDAVPLDETLRALERVRAAGKARFVGVSNFPCGLFRRALIEAGAACNQVEYHPYLDQSKLLALCRSHEAMLTAYTPLAKGRVEQDETIRAVAEAHGKTPSQVTLRWHVQQPNVAAIPKAASLANRKANLDIFDFALTDDEMARITALTAQNARIVNPGFAPDWSA